MEKVLNIGLDLGGDTMKIAFAYTAQNGQIVYGKFDNGDIKAGLPAQAFYDENNGKWYYAEEIAHQMCDSFDTVVKIKKLISLLAEQKNKTVCDRNSMYYRGKNVFPRFFFPDTRKVLSDINERDFRDVEKNQFTFTANGYTPKQVCEGFYLHLAKFIKGKVAALEKRFGLSFERIQYAVICQPEVGENYIREVVRLVEFAFHQAPFKLLSTTRALAMYAYHERILKNGEEVLLMDMGEEEISIAKAGAGGLGGKIFLDGADGHNPPLPLGGIDIDEAIGQLLEEKISSRRTFGGYREESVYAKRYRLMKDIKTAKVILSEVNADGKYPDSVPIWLGKEIEIRTSLTQEEVRQCIVKRPVTMKDKSSGSVAERIVEYIRKELKRPTNKKIDTLFLSGGLAESVPLVAYITEQLKNSHPKLKVITFDLRADGTEERDEFRLAVTEDGVYAPATGGAIVALRDLDIATQFAFSYGTFARSFPLNCPTKVLAYDVLVSREDSVDAKNPRKVGSYFWDVSVGKSLDYLKDGDLFAVALTNQEIQKKENVNMPKADIDACFREFRISENNVVWKITDKIIEMREEVRKAIQWELIDSLGIVNFFYKGKMVRIVPKVSGRISFSSGMQIGFNARAKRIIQNEMSWGSLPVTIYPVKKTGKGENAQYTCESTAGSSVDFSEIELRFESRDEIALKTFGA